MIVKSGADFRNLSYITVQLGAKPAEEELCNEEITDRNVETDIPYKFYVKNKFVVEVVKKDVTLDIPRDEELNKFVEGYYKDFDLLMEQPLFIISDNIDTTFEAIRTRERYIGNLVADLMALEMCTDVAFMNSGSLRADVEYQAGTLILGDMFDILPFITNICKVEVTGDVLLEILENSVCKWPAMEGRFLQMSRINFKFDPSKPENHRIEAKDVFVNKKPLVIDQHYTIATTEYVASGKDGFEPILKGNLLIDGENGPELMSVIKEYFKLPSNEKFRKEFKLANTDFKKFVNQHSESKYKNMWDKKRDTLKIIQNESTQLKVVELDNNPDSMMKGMFPSKDVIFLIFQNKNS